MHPNGRIWILWDPAIVNVQVLLSTDQIIHMKVTIIQLQIQFAVSFIYGHNYYILRRGFWDSLRSLAPDLVSVPWITLGDFNIIRFSNEKVGGNPSMPTYIDDLNDCCLDISLEDLRSSGHHLTWSKGSGQTFLARKLDRA